MSHASVPPPAAKLTSTQWLICVIASIGFAFDIYELLMLPLILRPALIELGGIQPGSPEFARWFSLLFYVPAVAGGVFGLLGGYLTDRLGRRAVLTWSILLYAFAAFAAGFSTSLYMLLFFRCLVFIGVCVEFVAAVAWLAELFENPEQREKVLGYTQAFSSIGGLLVAIANGLAIAWSTGKAYELVTGVSIPGFQLPAIQLPSFLTASLGQITEAGSHAPWRYTLMSGLIPAIPLILIRPFLPESPSWKRKREAGTMKRPSIAQLFSPQLKRTTIITTIMFTCSFAAAFGAIQQMPQIVPGLPEVETRVLTAVEKEMTEAQKPQFTAAKEKIDASPVSDELKRKQTYSAAVRIVGVPTFRKVAGPIEQAAASNATKIQEVGGLAGRFLLAILAVQIVSRRKLLRVFLVPGLIAMPLIFAWAATTSLSYLHIGIFIAGLLTVGQFSFWGNYLPRVYPMHLRGTGESFAANMGGRLVGTSFAAVTTTIAAMLVAPGAAPPPTTTGAPATTSETAPLPTATAAASPTATATATPTATAAATPTGTATAAAPPKAPTAHPIDVAHMTAFVAAGVALTVYFINFIASFWLPEPKEGEFDE